MTEEPAGTIIHHLQQRGLFSNLSVQAAEDLASDLVTVELPAGQWLFRQGNPGDSLFILTGGRVEVILRTAEDQEVIIDVLESGAPIGEMAFLSGQARSAGVRATEDSRLLQLTAVRYQELVARHPEISNSLRELALLHFRRTQLTGVLTLFFGPLDMATLHDLESKLVWRHIPGGEPLFKQGDPGSEMAIVVNGRLRIIASYPDGTVEFSTEIGRGQSTGEFSLLTGAPRSADVYAMRDSDLLLFSAESFEQISLKYPQIGLQLARNIARRNNQGSRVLKGTRAALSLALIPLSPNVDLREFARLLAKEMAAFGPTLLLTAQEFDARFGKEGASKTTVDDPVNIPILGWLSQLEEDHSFIIYQTAADDPDWNRRCLGQADRFVFLANPLDDPRPHSGEKEIIASHPLARSELVLLHQETPTGPPRTAVWLDPRKIHAHHHLRAGVNKDFRRFIRRLIGRPTGLVLSGGAARGFAHIGVYRALSEAGIEIDLIGGTSMGALLGAGMAAEFDYEELVQKASQYASKRTLLDYTFPAAALFETKKISSVLHEVFKETAIEDLPVPFFCVSSNLTEMRPYIHTSGLLWEAVRASIALPGAFAPVNFAGNILVDGGVMNNMPVDIMRDLCEDGQVIAVDVSPKQEKLQAWDFESSISGWQVLRSRLNPFRKPMRVPSLMDTLLHSMTVNSTYRLQLASVQADLLIQLDTSSYDTLDMEAYRELIELGYEAAQPIIASWLEAQQGA